MGLFIGQVLAGAVGLTVVVNGNSGGSAGRWMLLEAGSREL